MATDGRGSGFTTREIVREMQRMSAEQFKEAMSTTLKGKALDSASAAFHDGMTTMLRHLVGMGAIVVVEIEKEER